VQVLDRTIAVLQAVADSETDLAAADIARQLRLHKSTVHRLLVVLESYRLIKKGPEGAYGLGTRLIELGECAIARLKLAEYAEPHLRKIAEETARARTSRSSTAPNCCRSRTSRAAGTCTR
jgi:DNA-binding IclR family transcriptional regulator